MTDMGQTTANPDEVLTEDLEVEQHIEAPPEEVYEYFAESGRFPRPDDGGAVTVEERVAAERPSRVTYRVTVHREGGPSLPGSVEVILHPDGAGTLVRLVHRDVPAAALDAPRAHWGATLRAAAVLAPGRAIVLA